MVLMRKPHRPRYVGLSLPQQLRGIRSRQAGIESTHHNMELSPLTGLVEPTVEIYSGGVSLASLFNETNNTTSLENSSTPLPHYKLPHEVQQVYNSLKTRRKTSLPLCRFSTRMRSLSRWALSLAWPRGNMAAGAANSRSRKAMAGMEPPSRM